MEEMVLCGTKNGITEKYLFMSVSILSDVFFFIWFLNDFMYYMHTGRVFCQDGGGPLNGVEVVQSTAITAFITVKDMPDIDPQFLNLPNMVTINENSPVVSDIFHLFVGKFTV